jgi:glutamate N-acetyltransferase / amino-acid N-acetyltransferase
MTEGKKKLKLRMRKDRRWRVVRGGVTAPQGYLASGVAAGIKKAALDLAVLFSARPTSAAAVFTQNAAQAAPVILSRKHLRLSGGRAQALLVNSGCANACTGRKGLKDADICAGSLASQLELEKCRVIVASTGVIGAPLPLTRVLKGVSTAVSALSTRGGEAAARAIMTTDTHEKVYALESRIKGKPVRIGGMAKGAGMIHPDMATMIAVITTDARIPPLRLDRILRRAVDGTFNCLTVDGDTSTNDTVVLFANGASDVKVDGRWLAHFENGLTRVCEELARSIARDGEGATKFVEIRVSGAASVRDARKVGMSVANSPLVKTALFGEELNWGRIVCAAGNSGVAFNPDQITVSLGGVPVFQGGEPVTLTKRQARELMSPRDIEISIALGLGDRSAKIWTCDMSRDYIDINAGYMS